MNTQPQDPAHWLTDRNWLEATAPFALFSDWFVAATQHEPEDPNAMALSTVDSQGKPNVRIVLLKGFNERGFVLYTHAPSIKGQEMTHTPYAAGVFHWKSMRRQVRFRGAVEQVSAEEADEYFAGRPRESQIGAWASQQSQTLPHRGDFEARITQFTTQFEGKAVSRPVYWTGFRIIPVEIEFWQDRPHRLHDRLVFERTTPDEAWGKRMLYP